MRPLLVDVITGPFDATLHASFVANYWQKRPLLIRGLLTEREVEEYCPLTKDGLVGLACDSSALPSRLIREHEGERAWTCRRGPFHAAEFESLPDDGTLPWTLLVSGVDRALEPVEALREHTSAFAPRWRVDDVMVSYAPHGGSVGAHVDNYDVFLVQGRGTREWSVEASPRSAKDEALVAGLEVRILESFTPAATWELQPGDALYIPPRYAHHGVSTSPACLSYSVGFRAPSAAELLTSFVSYAAERALPEDVRYSDAELPVASTPAARGSIDAYAVGGVRALLKAAAADLLSDDETFEAWIGTALTAPRAGRPSATGARVGAAEEEEGPLELGPVGQDEMAAWIRELEGSDRAANGAASGEAVTTAGPTYVEDEEDEEEEERRLAAELDAALLTFGDAPEDDEEPAGAEAANDDHDASDEHIPPEGDHAVDELVAMGARGLGSLGSVTQLLRALAEEADSAPPALRLVEGAVMAYVAHPNGGASVFVDGELISTLSAADAAYAPLLCASTRIDAAALAPALRESTEFAELVEQCVRRDLLWAEV